MKKLFKGISLFVMLAVMITAASVTAFASSAKTGDSVEVTVSIEGEDSMGSATIQINYDKNKFDLLSDETLEGTGLSNTTEAGVILWADMFDTEGANYSSKTDVYKAILIAKQDISDVESLISFTATDAYRIGASGIEKTDLSHLSCSIALEGGDASAGSVNSKSNNNAAANSKASKTDSQTASSSSGSSGSKADKTDSSSPASSKASESSKPAESSSESESRDSEKLSDTDTAEESTVSIIESYDEAEFESVPPIKLDQETHAADSRGAFPKGAVVGIAACLVIAAAGIAVIMAKKKG